MRREPVILSVPVDTKPERLTGTEGSYVGRAEWLRQLTVGGREPVPPQAMRAAGYRPATPESNPKEGV